MTVSFIVIYKLVWSKTMTKLTLVDKRSKVTISHFCKYGSGILIFLFFHSAVCTVQSNAL